MKVVNPKGPNRLVPLGPNEVSNRVPHGGSLDDYANYLVASYRAIRLPGYHRFNLGFRIVCNGRNA